MENDLVRVQQDFETAAHRQAGRRSNDRDWRISHRQQGLLVVVEKCIEAVHILVNDKIENALQVCAARKMLGIIVNNEPGHVC